MSLPPVYNLPGTKPCSTLLSQEMLSTLQEIAGMTPPGDIVELGVYRGGSARALEWVAAGRPGCTLWLYDTFRGIPCSDPAMGDVHKVGDFGDGLTEAEARERFPNARIWAGWFPGDAPLPKRIAFAHLDGDQYQSTRDALAAFMPRMVPGGIILLDDYQLPGCARAADEFRAAGHDLQWLPFPDCRAMFMVPE